MRPRMRSVSALADGPRGPFQLLYILHTTRTGAELGRYESSELTLSVVQDFLRQFGRFLSEDSRHGCGSVGTTMMRQSSWIDTI